MSELRKPLPWPCSPWATARSHQDPYFYGKTIFFNSIMRSTCVSQGSYTLDREAHCICYLPVCPPAACSHSLTVPIPTFYLPSWCGVCHFLSIYPLPYSSPSWLCLPVSFLPSSLTIRPTLPQPSSSSTGLFFFDCMTQCKLWSSSKSKVP